MKRHVEQCEEEFKELQGHFLSALPQKYLHIGSSVRTEIEALTSLIDIILDLPSRTIYYAVSDRVELRS